MPCPQPPLTNYHRYDIPVGTMVCNGKRIPPPYSFIEKPESYPIPDRDNKHRNHRSAKTSRQRITRSTESPPNLTEDIPFYPALLLTAASPPGSVETPQPNPIAGGCESDDDEDEGIYVASVSVDNLPPGIPMSPKTNP